MQSQKVKHVIFANPGDESTVAARLAYIAHDLSSLQKLGVLTKRQKISAFAAKLEGIIKYVKAIFQIEKKLTSEGCPTGESKSKRYVKLVFDPKRAKADPIISSKSGLVTTPGYSLQGELTSKDLKAVRKHLEKEIVVLNSLFSSGLTTTVDHSYLARCLDQRRRESKYSEILNYENLYDYTVRALNSRNRLYAATDAGYDYIVAESAFFQNIYEESGHEPKSDELVQSFLKALTNKVYTGKFLSFLFSMALARNNPGGATNIDDDPTVLDRVYAPTENMTKFLDLQNDIKYLDLTRVIKNPKYFIPCPTITVRVSSRLAPRLSKTEESGSTPSSSSCFGYFKPGAKKAGDKRDIQQRTKDLLADVQKFVAASGVMEIKSLAPDYYFNSARPETGKTIRNNAAATIGWFDYGKISLALIMKQWAVTASVEKAKKKALDKEASILSGRPSSGSREDASL